jgi:hypothetical protein
MNNVIQFLGSRRLEHVSALKEVMRAAMRGLGEGLSFEKHELLALELANEAIREALEEELQEVAEGFSERVQVCGLEYQRHCEGNGVYRSLCGDLVVRRYTYRRVGIRNGPTIVPLELQAGLVENATPALAKSIALGYAKGPIRHWEEDLRAAGRCPPPRATSERLAKTLGTKIKARIVEVEPAIRRRERLPEGAHGVCLSLDRTSAPMEELREPGIPPKTRRKPRARPYLRKPPPPVDVHYRMVYVGTVTIFNNSGEALVKRSYGATAAEGPEQILIRMMSDARAALAEDPDLIVAVVQDGAPEMWGWIWDMTRVHFPQQNVHQLVDWFHMMEHVSAAFQMLEPVQEKREALLDKWRHSLLTSPTGTRRLAEWLDSRAPAKTTMKAAYWGHLAYIAGLETRSNYAKFRALGLPIGSGPTEGACKFLVAGRAKRSGQRWHEQGLAAVLTLRAIHYSERFDLYWNVFKHDYREVVRTAA